MNPDFFILGISKPCLMEEGAKFKFEPIWVSALGLMSLFILYKVFSVFVADPSYDLFGLIFLSCPLIFSAMTLPMFF